MVSIIIPTLSEKSKKYLDLCIQSIENLDLDGQIEIIISSPKGYAPAYNTAITYEHTGERDFAEAINLGVKQASPESKYYLLLSDDTVLTKDSVKNLIQATGDGNYIMNATSNCDNYDKYWFLFQTSSHAISGRFFKMEDTDAVGITHELKDAKSGYPRGIIFTPSVCFYATLIPRKVWDRVGELDTQFKTGYEDTDYCIRANGLGIRCAIALDALIWHFGGVTSSEYLTEEMTANNKKAFDQKWSTKGKT